MLSQKERAETSAQCTLLTPPSLNLENDVSCEKHGRYSLKTKIVKRKDTLELVCWTKKQNNMLKPPSWGFTC